jgi:hypothetical protein
MGGRKNATTVIYVKKAYSVLVLSKIEKEQVA